METRLRAGQSEAWDSVSERVNLLSSPQPLNPSGVHLFSYLMGTAGPLPGSGRLVGKPGYINTKVYSLSLVPSCRAVN